MGMIPRVHKYILIFFTIQTKVQIHSDEIILITSHLLASSLMGLGVVILAEW